MRRNPKTFKTWNDVFRACFPNQKTFEHSRKNLEMQFPGMGDEPLEFLPGTDHDVECQRLVAHIRKGMVRCFQDPEFRQKLLAYNAGMFATHAAKN